MSRDLRNAHVLQDLYFNLFLSIKEKKKLLNLNWGLLSVKLE